MVSSDVHLLLQSDYFERLGERDPSFEWNNGEVFFSHRNYCIEGDVPPIQIMYLIRPLV